MSKACWRPGIFGLGRQQAAVLISVRADHKEFLAVHQ